MALRVYSGPPGTEMVSPLDKDHMLFKEFATYDEALSWAGHIKDTGRVALLIEDDSGATHLDKRDIAAILGQRDAQAADAPASR
jgi:hypothetical protein